MLDKLILELAPKNVSIPFDFFKKLYVDPVYIAWLISYDRLDAFLGNLGKYVLKKCMFTTGQYYAHEIFHGIITTQFKDFSSCQQIFIDLTIKSLNWPKLTILCTNLKQYITRKNDLVVRALDYQIRDPETKIKEWVQGRLNLSHFRGQSNEYQELPET